MIPTFRDLKTNAREVLAGNYSVLIMVYLLVGLISTLLSTLFTPNSANISTQQLIIYYVADFIITLLVYVFAAGLIKMIMNIIRGEKIYPRMIFFAFRDQADRFFITSFLILLILDLPSIVVTIYLYLVGRMAVYPVWADAVYYVLLVVFTIIAVVLFLQYIFALHILLDDNYCSGIEALRRSRELTRGNRLRMFGLFLSFIGWILLGVLSCFIGFLWIIPYIMTVFTYYYFGLTGELTEAVAGDQTSSDAQPFA